MMIKLSVKRKDLPPFFLYKPESLFVVIPDIFHRESILVVLRMDAR